MGRPQLTVIAPASLGVGYRLAGVRTEDADTAVAAGAALDRLLAAHDRPGVIAVYPPYLRELDSGWHHRLAALDGALVVPLPEGAVEGTPAPGGESLRDLLARAIGYEFTFDPERSTA
jgi:vacuolar-type H+-ATPase subunit F/Vma7